MVVETGGWLPKEEAVAMVLLPKTLVAAAVVTAAEGAVTDVEEGRLGS